MVEIRCIVDAKNHLGEGPLWDVQDRKIYWVDSLGATLPSSDKHFYTTKTVTATTALADGRHAFSAGIKTRETRETRETAARRRNIFCV